MTLSQIPGSGLWCWASCLTVKHLTILGSQFQGSHCWSSTQGFLPHTHEALFTLPGTHLGSLLKIQSENAHKPSSWNPRPKHFGFFGVYPVLCFNIHLQLFHILWFYRPPSFIRTSRMKSSEDAPHREWVPEEWKIWWHMTSSAIHSISFLLYPSASLFDWNLLRGGTELTVFPGSAFCLYTADS